jgi:hypothetical protein
MRPAFFNHRQALLWSKAARPRIARGGIELAQGACRAKLRIASEIKGRVRYYVANDTMRRRKF